MHLINYLKQKHTDLFVYYISLSFVSLFFCGVYLFLSIFPSVKQIPMIRVAGYFEPGILILNQPDESSNYLFIRERVLHNRARIPEPLSKASNQQLHPRSTTIIHDEIAPIGFPGLIMLYSGLVKLVLPFFGQMYFNVIAVLLTPLLAALTPLIFFAWLKEFWGRRLAFLSALLLYILPPWWYYASRSFQHATVFVFFLLVGLYALMKWAKSQTETQKVIWIFFAGLGLATSLYIRPVEALWVSGLCLAQILLYRREIRRTHLVALLLSISMIAGLFFITQKLFYDHPLGSGYAKPAIDGSAGLITEHPQGISFFKVLIVPFGFHPTAMLKTAYEYGIHLFAPWFLLAVIGLILVLCSNRFKKDSVFRLSEEIIIPTARDYAWLFIAVCSYLVMYYGSWLFFDNVAGVYSIGSSQVRYFLPLYVFSLPFLAAVILTFFQRHWSSAFVAVIIIIVLALFSFRSVFLRFEGLVDIKATVADYYLWQKRIYRLTPAEAIVVTRYADKYLYPGRKVITDWSDESLDSARKLSQLGFPLYWYDLVLSSQESFDLKEKLRAHKLVLSEPVTVWSDLELRHIRPLIEKP